MTSLYLAASPMAYLLICCWLAIRTLRGELGCGFYRLRGAWELTLRVRWQSFKIGVDVWNSSEMADVYFGFITATVRYDACTAKRKAQAKADAKAVDSLLASLPREVPE